MSRPRRAAVLTAVTCLFSVSACGEKQKAPAPPPERDRSVTLVPAPRGESAPLPLRAAGGADLGARLREPALLRDSPAGQPVGRLRTRTEFGSPRILAVVRRRPGWLGVIVSQRPNGSIGWIAQRRAELVREPVRIRVDISQRRLRVLRAGRTVLSMTVGVGRSANPTPTGRFAVTDGLRTRPGSAGSPYGCCILALSGHQPNVPQGWSSGDRLAVHGTTDPESIGRASSSGCLRARERDLRRLLRLATLGARVDIRR